jgi:hypothetical protein
MAYSDLANNQGVSFNSLISGVSQGYFTAKTTIPSSTQMVTKSACNTYVNIDTSYAPFASKANNQLVVKEDLRNDQATLYITNGFFTGTITNVTVNGVSITGASFPLNVGSGTTGYTTQIGTYEILVYYADATNPGNYMEIIDSEYNSTCIDNFSSFGPDPYVTFISQVVNSSIPVTIVSGDGSCPGPIPPPPISTLPFSTVAVSRGTGQYMLAGNANIGNPFSEGPLFRSTNYGATWTLQGQFGYWNKVATSDNGQYMLAVEWYGRAYKSSDYGANWTAINNFPFPDSQPCPSTPLSALQTLKFRGAALSGDGQYQVISTAPIIYGTCTGSPPISFSYSSIFVSNDYGATWTSRVTRSNDGTVFDSVAISESGQTVLATRGNTDIGQGLILRSTNYGVNWSDTTNSFAAGNLVDVAITADGLNAISARFSNNYMPFLIKSVDGGGTWSTITGGGIISQQTWKRVCINNYQNLDVRAWAIPNSRVFGSTPGPYYMFTVTSGISTVTEYTSGSGLGEKYFKSLANSNNGQYLLVGANNGLFLSSNYGSTFTAIS